MSNKIDDLKAQLAAVDARLANNKDNSPSADQVFGKGVPAIRTGESVLNSRGFSFQKLFAHLGGLTSPEECKNELNLCAKVKSTSVGQGYKFGSAKSYLAPLDSKLMYGQEIDDNYRYEIKCMMDTGSAGYDPDEARYYKQKSVQSWLDTSIGAPFVAEPAQGSVIELLRNNAALTSAGATVTALPAQGRIRFPRVVSPTTGYWVNENSTITQSNLGTSFLELAGKKCACIVTMSNELLRFSNPSIEQVIRQDMTKTLGLTLDYALLVNGPGSDSTPLSLLLTSGVASVTPSGSASQLTAGDAYQFISKVEQNNGNFEGYIMNPAMFYQFVSNRAGVYNGSGISELGNFTFSQLRQMGEGFSKNIGGFKVTTSNQVPLTMGSGSQTAVYGGMWSNYIMALFGSIEFAANPYGTNFDNDVTSVRAILTADGGIRNPGTIAVANPVALTVE